VTPCAQGRCATRLRYAPTKISVESRLKQNVWRGCFDYT
jgi:hypothetical protein